MRILQTGDLHLEIATHGQLDAARGMSSRLVDQEMTLQWILQTAQAQGVTVIVIAGDITHQKVLRGAALDMFVRFLAKAAAEGIMVIMLDGNHDIESGGQAPSTISALNGVHGAIGVDRPMVIRLDDTTDLLALPFPNRGIMQNAGVQYGDVGTLFSAILGGMLVDSKAAQRIVAAHITVGGSTWNPDAQPNIQSPSDLTVAGPVLYPEGVRMALCGHIHQRQKVGKCFYAGAPLAFDFGDGDGPKGVSVVDLEVGHVEHFNNPYNRPFVTIDGTLPIHVPPGAFVRCKVGRALSDSEKADIRKALGQFDIIFCGFIEETERVVRPEAVAVVQAQTPDEIVRAYCQAVGGEFAEHADELVSVLHGQEVSGL